MLALHVEPATVGSPGRFAPATKNKDKGTMKKLTVQQAERILRDAGRYPGSWGEMSDRERDDWTLEVASTILADREQARLVELEDELACPYTATDDSPGSR